MTKKTSRYADTPLETQKARCVLTVICLAQALENMPQDYVCKKYEKAIAERVIKWHGKVCDELDQSPLKKAAKMAVEYKLKKFEQFAARSKTFFHKTAMLCCSEYLFLDARVTAPSLSGSRCWHYLAKALDQLTEFLLKTNAKADELGTDFYLELVWAA